MMVFGVAVPLRVITVPFIPEIVGFVPKES